MPAIPVKTILEMTDAELQSAIREVESQAEELPYYWTARLKGIAAGFLRSHAREMKNELAIRAAENEAVVRLAEIANEKARSEAAFEAIRAESRGEVPNAT